MNIARTWFLPLAVAGCAMAGSPETTSDASRLLTGDARTDAHVSDSARAIDGKPDGASAGCAYSGVLATWTLAGQTGSQSSTAAASSASTVTAGGVSRSPSITAASGSGSINSSNWSTSAQLDATKYYTFSITPSAGCSMSLTSMSIDALASGTGPALAAVATSADAFVQTAVVSTTAPSAPALSASGASGSVEIRVYGYSASGTSGTMRVQNTLTVTGSTQ